MAKHGEKLSGISCRIPGGAMEDLVGKNADECHPGMIGIVLSAASRHELSTVMCRGEYVARILI